MKLGTCGAGYSLITEHGAMDVRMWDAKLADKGEYLFEVPDERIISQYKEHDSEDIEYGVNASEGDITYIGREN